MYINKSWFSNKNQQKPGLHEGFSKLQGSDLGCSKVSTTDSAKNDYILHVDARNGNEENLKVERKRR